MITVLIDKLDKRGGGRCGDRGLTTAGDKPSRPQGGWISGAGFDYGNGKTMCRPNRTASHGGLERFFWRQPPRSLVP